MPYLYPVNFVVDYASTPEDVMATESITIKSADGLEFEAYVSRPSAEDAPVVVVIQEIFGVNKWLRTVADMLAEKGFIAVAPDLFHRMEKGVQLNNYTEDEWKRAFQFYQNFDVDKGVDDLKQTVQAVRKINGASGKVGTVGFCLGGKLAYLMSARSDADANVGYYGVGIEEDLDEKPKHPLMLHIAEADEYVPKEAQATIKAALQNNDKVTIHSYPGQDHAFSRVGGDHYNKEAAEQAHKRTIEFFKDKLQNSGASA
jgi:carboxymethylenebutenolidase